MMMMMMMIGLECDCGKWKRDRNTKSAKWSKDGDLVKWKRRRSAIERKKCRLTANRMVRVCQTNRTNSCAEDDDDSEKMKMIVAPISQDVVGKWKVSHPILGDRWTAEAISECVRESRRCEDALWRRMKSRRVINDVVQRHKRKKVKAGPRKCGMMRGRKGNQSEMI